MEFSEVIRKRRSIRGFKPDQVPRETIEKVLEIARRSPSWSNVQGWHVAITGGEVTETLRREIAQQVQTGSAPPQPELPWLWSFPEPFKGRRVECAKTLYGHMGIEYEDRPARARAVLRNFVFFDAPHLAVLSAPQALGHYGLVDLGAFMQSFLLALVDHGLDGCAQASVASYAPRLRESLEIPEDYWVVCAIAFGYADPDEPANRTETTRMPMEELAVWSGFDE